MQNHGHGFARPSSPLHDLPDKIRVKILRLVLLQPGKIRVVARVDDNDTEPDELFDLQWASTYKFFLAVKVPPFLVSPCPTVRRGSMQSLGYYRYLDEPVALLAICAVNKLKNL
jgi:hypothetical protein